MQLQRRTVIAGLAGAGVAAVGGRAILRSDSQTSSADTDQSSPYADVSQFGAVGDGKADDTGAIQRAIEATLGKGDGSLHGGKLVLPKGVYRITDTLTVAQASMSLEGVGWSGGQLVDPQTRGSVLVWDGPAGVPMLRLDYCSGTTVTGIRFAGKAGARPSAAVSLRNLQAQPSGSNFNRLSDLWIGNMSGYDPGDGDLQFANGILLEGDNVHGDTNRFDNLVIFGCTVGVNITREEFVRNHFSGLRVNNCGTAFKSNATVSTSGDNWVLSRSSVADIELGRAARLRVDGLSSEFSRRLAVTESSSLMLRDGYWQMGPQMAEDGVIIDGRRGTGRAFLRIEDLDFTNEGARAPGRILWEPAAQVFLSNVIGP